jgi:hypothetical protein
MDNGFKPLSIYLPSNYELDSSNKIYKKSKYQFLITDIESIPITLSAFNLSAKTKRFDNLILQLDELESSQVIDEIEYFMVSKIQNIKTRLNYNGQSYICGNGISNNSVTIEMNGALLLTEYLNGNSNLGGTKIYKTKFSKDLIIYNDCLNSQNNSMLIPIKISTNSNF